MKKLLLAGTALGGLMLAESALAADLPVKAPPVMVAPVFSWTGCYIGGHVGGARGQKEWSGFTDQFGEALGGALLDVSFLTTVVVAASTTQLFTLTEVSGTSTITHVHAVTGPTSIPRTFTGSASTNTVTSISDDSAGFLAGGQVGCDYQFAPKLVIGIGGSGSWAHITGTVDMPFSTGASNTLVSSFTFGDGFAILDGVLPGFIVPGSFLSAHSNTNWLADATVRLGYVPWDRWLFYVKGGAAWAGDKYNASGSACTGGVTFPGPTCNSTTPFDFRAKENRFGWTTGLGVEYAFWNWSSIFIEWDYYDFGTRHVTFTDRLGQLECGERSACVGGADIGQRINVLKAGLNFRFNWGKAPTPVVARY